MNGCVYTRGLNQPQRRQDDRFVRWTRCNALLNKWGPVQQHMRRAYLRVVLYLNAGGVIEDPREHIQVVPPVVLPLQSKDKLQVARIVQEST